MISGADVPVTAKLSKLFYERLGDQVANELVDWFNRVDEANRADLRELNDLNFARIEAKFASKSDLADLKSELKSEMKAGFGELRARMDTMAPRSAIGELKAELREARLETKADIAELREFLERRLGEQTRWTAGALLAMMIPMIGILVGVWRR
jgi:hypothetical protein